MRMQSLQKRTSVRNAARKHERSAFAPNAAPMSPAISSCTYSPRPTEAKTSTIAEEAPRLLRAERDERTGEQLGPDEDPILRQNRNRVARAAGRDERFGAGDLTRHDCPEFQARNGLERIRDHAADRDRRRRTSGPRRGLGDQA